MYKGTVFLIGIITAVGSKFLYTVKLCYYRHSWDKKNVFVLRGALIKRVNFKGSVWSRTKKTVHNDGCPY